MWVQGRPQGGVAWAVPRAHTRWVDEGLEGPLVSISMACRVLAFSEPQFLQLNQRRTCWREEQPVWVQTGLPSAQVHM